LRSSFTPQEKLVGNGELSRATRFAGEDLLVEVGENSTGFCGHIAKFEIISDLLKEMLAAQGSMPSVSVIARSCRVLLPIQSLLAVLRETNRALQFQVDCRLRSRGVGATEKE
jgi:hypothetical protein